MKYNCIIVDDELPARKLLSDYVSKIDSLQLAGVCKNGLEAKHLLDESPVDILLLERTGHAANYHSYYCL